MKGEKNTVFGLLATIFFYHERRINEYTACNIYIMSYNVNLLPLNETGLYLSLYHVYWCPYIHVHIPARAQMTV